MDNMENMTHHLKSWRTFQMTLKQNVWNFVYFRCSGIGLWYMIVQLVLLGATVDSMSELEMKVDTANSTPLYHRGRPENWLTALSSLREEHRGYEGLLGERRRMGRWRSSGTQPQKHKAWKHQYSTDAVLLPCSKNSDLLFKFFKEMDSTWEIKMLEKMNL